MGSCLEELGRGVKIGQHDKWIEGKRIRLVVKNSYCLRRGMCKASVGAFRRAWASRY
jgi:hypothetical protein